MTDDLQKRVAAWMIKCFGSIRRKSSKRYVPNRRLNLTAARYQGGALHEFIDEANHRNRGRK